MRKLACELTGTECVPNFSIPNHISYIIEMGKTIAPHLGCNTEIRNPKSEIKKLIVLESTTYPGTTDEDLRAVLEAGSGLKAGNGQVRKA